MGPAWLFQFPKRLIAETAGSDFAWRLLEYNDKPHMSRVEAHRDFYLRKLTTTLVRVQLHVHLDHGLAAVQAGSGAGAVAPSSQYLY
jgi:hypothetical protein